MRIRIPWLTRKAKKLELSTLEERIKAALPPVQARPDFLENLRGQLLAREDHLIFGLPAKTLRGGLLVVGAVISGLLMIIAGIRTLASFLGIVGLLRRVRGSAKDSEAEASS